MADQMTPLQKIVLLLTFYTSPWGAAKGAMWEFFSNDRPFTEDVIVNIIGLIARGNDEGNVNWQDLELFRDDMLKALGSTGDVGSNG